jgi:hypothetical protein
MEQFAEEHMARRGFRKIYMSVEIVVETGRTQLAAPQPAAAAAVSAAATSAAASTSGGGRRAIRRDCNSRHRRRQPASGWLAPAGAGLGQEPGVLLMLLFPYCTVPYSHLVITS